MKFIRFDYVCREVNVSTLQAGLHDISSFNVTGELWRGAYQYSTLQCRHQAGLDDFSSLNISHCGAMTRQISAHTTRTTTDQYGDRSLVLHGWYYIRYSKNAGPPCCTNCNSPYTRERSVCQLSFINIHNYPAGPIAAGVGRVFSRVCLSVCLFVRALKGQRLELSTPNVAHILYSSRSLACIDPQVNPSSYGRVLLVPAWVCMSIRLLTFSRYTSVYNTIVRE